MKDLVELKENAIGGINAVYKGSPYTLTKSEESAARSGAWGYVSPISSEEIIKMVNRAKYTERLWRDAELSKVDIEVNKATDEGGIMAGSSWRTYRILLRDWPEHAEFPNSEFRPTKGDDA